MSKYVDLLKVNTNYARRMNYLSNRIFGEIARETSSTSTKAVKLMSQKPIQKCPEIVERYPRHPDINKLMLTLRSLGLYKDEHRDFVEEHKRLRALRGKYPWVPPPFRKKNFNK